MEASEQAGASHGSYRSYLIGFALSIILTLISFGLVMNGTLPKALILVCISAAALLQIFVQLAFFLHLSAASEQRWNLAALALTVLVTLLLVGGSLWIMYNLEVRMMDHVPPADAMLQPADAMQQH